MKITPIRRTDPDITRAWLEAVKEMLPAPRLAGGPAVAAFEAANGGLAS